MSISRMMVFSVVVAATSVALNGWVYAAETQLKQPVFLLCPHTSEYSAWSLYLVVDEKDPSRVLSLGLEGLKDQNSKDSSYADVLVAQNNPKIVREFVAGLDAKNFSSGQLIVKNFDALRISLALQPDKSLILTISMRVSASGRFVIGGKELATRNVALVYDRTRSVWLARVTALSDSNGDKVPLVAGKTITGIIFPLTSTGVYTVMGVMESGDSMVLMDRSAVTSRD